MLTVEACHGRMPKVDNRKAVNYLTRGVSDELIKEILEISATAPSRYNLQPWEALVVKDKEKKRQLKDICYRQQKVEDAS